MRAEEIAAESDLPFGTLSDWPQWGHIGNCPLVEGIFCSVMIFFDQQPYGVLQLFDRVTLKDTSIGYSINEQWGTNNEWLIDARPRALDAFISLGSAYCSPD